MRLLKNRKGVTGIVIALVITLVALAVIIPIGLMVTTQLDTSIKTTLKTPSFAPNASWTKPQNVSKSVFDNIWTAFSLSALVPIIAVAGLLIAIIVGAFAIRGRTR